VLLITGAMNKKSAPIMKKVYAQAPKPVFVVACGICACSQHMFKDSYNVDEPLDKIIPVDLYVPGCPPKPEAIISGILQLVKKIKKGK
jgi:ech hydrogenase subunit C/membrane-bound hydrogenase subunit mbhJ